jgi:hypothetical protein
MTTDIRLVISFSSPRSMRTPYSRSGQLETKTPASCGGGTKHSFVSNRIPLALMALIKLFSSVPFQIIDPLLNYRTALLSEFPTSPLSLKTG